MATNKTSPMLLFVVLLLIISTNSTQGQSQSMVWVETSLKNVAIESLAATNTSLYACQRSALYQSNNNAGTSWLGTGNGVDGGNRIGVYAGLGSAIFASADPFLTSRGAIGGGSFRSLDSGKTWTSLRIGPFVSGITKTSLALFIPDYISGVMRSLDNGTTWSTIASISSLLPPYSVVGICANSRQVFICTSNAVFSSQNNGDSWQQIARDILGIGAWGDGKFFSSLSRASVASDSILFVGAASTQGKTGVFRLNFLQGNGWWVNSLPNVNVSSFAIKNDTIFCGTDNGIFYSADSGLSWDSVNTGLSDKTVSGQPSRAASCLTVDSQGYLYAAGSNGSVYRLSYTSQRTSTRDLTLPSPITISPNPVHEALTLALSENDLHRVRLTSALGTAVATLSEASGTTTLDVSGLAAGVYFVEVESARTRQRTVQKVVKY